MGKVLVIAGLVLVFAGLLLQWGPGALAWFGKLPGDLRIERDHGIILVPLTSMLLVSLVLTLLLNLLFRR